MRFGKKKKIGKLWPPPRGGGSRAKKPVSDSEISHPFRGRTHLRQWYCPAQRVENLCWLEKGCWVAGPPRGDARKRPPVPRFRSTESRSCVVGGGGSRIHTATGFFSFSNHQVTTFCLDVLWVHSFGAWLGLSQASLKEAIQGPATWAPNSNPPEGGVNICSLLIAPTQGDLRQKGACKCDKLVRCNVTNGEIRQ